MGAVVNHPSEYIYYARRAIPACQAFLGTNVTYVGLRGVMSRGRYANHRFARPRNIARLVDGSRQKVEAEGENAVDGDQHCAFKPIGSPVECHEGGDE